MVTTQEPRLLFHGGVDRMLESSHINTYATDSVLLAPCHEAKSKTPESLQWMKRRIHEKD